MDKNYIEKIPPNNIKIEQLLLGALIVDSNLSEKISFISSDDFYNISHNTIFEAMRKLKEFDIIILANYLKEKKLLTKIGGDTYLAKLCNSITTTGTGKIIRHAEIIKKKSRLRKMINSCHLIIDKGYKEESEINELISDFENTKNELLFNAKKNIFKIDNLKDVVKQNYGDYEYLVKDLIPKTGITVISSRPKSGKSWFVLHILIQISSGQKVFGHYHTQKSNVLLIDEENSLRGIQRRTKKITENTPDIPIINFKGFRIDNREHRLWLIDFIKEKQIELVVFDSFRRLHDLDENKSENITELYNCFKEIMKTEVAVLLVYHNKKADRHQKVNIESLRGSIDISAICESILLLDTKSSGSLPGSSTTVYPILREESNSGPFTVDWYDNEEGNQIIFDYKGGQTGNINKIEEAKKFVLETLDKERREFTINEFIDKKNNASLDFGISAIREACRILVSEYLLDARMGDGKFNRTKYYSLKI
ncbi:AAA family ATPase [Candidatus Parcubacteria bacterium]|nr:AAA family ATPase [Candidatus Parcubacteria bacterium]